MNPKVWNLLLVEDLPIYIALMQSLLQDSGHCLDIAKSLASGLEKSKIQTYDAVLLDLGLPDSQGLETFYKFSQSNPSTPVIIFSSSDDVKIALQALQHGAQDYLVKGSYLTFENIGSLIISRAIAYAIERYQIQQELLRERSLLEQRVTERTCEIKSANIHLQKLASSLVNAQEAERRRISLELHDEAGQFLTALKLSLNMIQTELGSHSSALTSQMAEASQLTDTIIEKLRTLAHDLRPPAIDALGLNQVIQDLCRKTARQTGVEIAYSGSQIDFPTHIQLSLYRVVQEALTNIIKHANASRVEVCLAVDAEQISLVVSDNGCGFSLTDLSALKSFDGIGLLGIQDRIEAIGGAFAIKTQPHQGTILSVMIPLQDAV
jgi:signal transduction histidine kinase